jgi:PAS domain S-box-containing protein
MLKKIVTTNGAPHRDDTSVAQLERELRANEQRWGAIMANPFMGITVLDHNHYFIMANSTYQNMVGYTNDELKKLTPLDITPAGEREINKAFFAELQEGKRQHFELVKRLQRKDGKLIWIQLYVFKIPDRDSVGQNTFAMVFDITGENASTGRAAGRPCRACARLTGEPNGCYDRVNRA